MRDKIEKPLRIEGKNVILEEIQQKYFSYVIKWRNDSELNKYINQPEKLTMEKEQQWYEKIYLKDDTQGFFIMINTATKEPFGTIGWTDMDVDKNWCILGRLLSASTDDAFAMLEGNLLLSRYLYDWVDKIYVHVVCDNKKALRWDKSLGFSEHAVAATFPRELMVNGFQQVEMYRTKDEFEPIWRKYSRLLKLDVNI